MQKIKGQLVYQSYTSHNIWKVIFKISFYVEIFNGQLVVYSANEILTTVNNVHTTQCNRYCSFGILLQEFIAKVSSLAHLVSVVYIFPSFWHIRHSESVLYTNEIHRK